MSGPVVTYHDTHNLALPLLLMMHDFVGSGSPNPIPEIVYLNQISETGRLPGETFYSRAIITQTIVRHTAVMENVSSDFRFSKRFYCQFYKDGRRRIFKFSNTMPLFADIITIHYLNMLRWIRLDYPILIRKLRQLMMDKYMIVDEDTICNTWRLNYETCELTCENRNCLCNDPKRITMGRIVRSYVSVALWMSNYISQFTILVRQVFPYSKLPPMISLTCFPLVLSKRIGLDNKYLLAVNMAIVAADGMLPILMIYGRIFKFTSSFDVYTEDMRIYICIKLGIVIKRDDKYFFPRKLEKHRSYYVIAKDKLRRMRENDITFERFETINELFY